jgi:hypothetical protein
MPFKDLEARKLGCNGFFNDFIHKVKNSGYKFALYSTHDIMIVGLLSCLEVKE